MRPLKTALCLHISLLSLILGACQTMGDDGDIKEIADESKGDFSLAKAALYANPDGPKYEGEYAADSPPFRDLLTVITYNIKEGEAVDKAGEAFHSFEELKKGDIILLQEMDESGVDQISQMLQMNFVYYPTFVSRDGRNVGNAILARWPLEDSAKLILPGTHPLSGQKRIAVRATIRHSGKKLLVYSIHTETYSSMPGHRKDQVDAIVTDIGSGESPVIAGGDFNTVSRRSIRRMTGQFATIGLERVTAGSGPTIAKFGVSRVAADHIFARGFNKVASGTVKDVDASDHYPLWVILKWR